MTAISFIILTTNIYTYILTFIRVLNSAEGTIEMPLIDSAKLCSTESTTKIIL